MQIFHLIKTSCQNSILDFLFLCSKICSYEILAIEIHGTEEYIVTRVSPETQPVSEH